MIDIQNNFTDVYFENALLKDYPPIRKNGTERSQIIRFGENVIYPNSIANIPAIFDVFKDKLEFTSVQLNEYQPGQKIEPHIDNSKRGEVIQILSLLSDCYIKFHNKNITNEYLLPRYSLLTFSEEHRTIWKHSVDVTEHRYSIIFRNYKQD
jgi:hypothetical protein